MNKKSLILSILLVLMVFLSVTVVSAADDANIDIISDTPTSSEVTVNTTDTNDQIQEKINENIL